MELNYFRSYYQKKMKKSPTTNRELDQQVQLKIKTYT